jgi:hypothetical protein
MKVMSKILAGATLAITLAGSLAVTGPAHAGSKGRKNTAIALGALAAHQLLTGKTTNGILAGAGAAAAYQKYKEAKDDEDRYGYRRRADRSRSDRYRSSDRYNDRYGYDGYTDGGNTRYDSGYGYNRSGYAGTSYGRTGYNRASDRYRDGDKDCERDGTRYDRRTPRRDSVRYDRSRRSDRYNRR